MPLDLVEQIVLQQATLIVHPGMQNTFYPLLDQNFQKLPSLLLGGAGFANGFLARAGGSVKIEGKPPFLDRVHGTHSRYYKFKAKVLFPQEL